jgi:peptidoglycan-associated lipoprotein
MFSKFIRAIVLAGVTITMAASCASKPKTSGAEGSGMGDGQPILGGESISSDPMGSDSGNIPGLSTIYFEYDQARLTTESRRQLSENAQWIRDNPSFTIQIEGHTDERGSVEYNLALGERRAKSVKTFLEGLGIDSRRMTIISYGEEKPLVSGSTESAWGRNRRANFVPIR